MGEMASNSTLIFPNQTYANETVPNVTSVEKVQYINITMEMPIAYAVPLYGYVMPFLLIITIIANTLIVVVLSKRQMRTPTNVVLMAMALCDMFTVLIPAPWLIYMYSFGNHYKPLWPISLCYAWFVMHEVDVLWNNHTTHVCKREHAHWVKEYVTEDFYFVTYFMFRVLFVHLIPCVALVILNILLFRALKQAQQRREQLLSKKNQKNECKKLRDSNCTTLMLIVVVTVFLIVEIPLVVVTLLHIISSTFIEFLDYYVANTLILFTNFFIILSYPINFAIYCGMSRQFRETFKELFIRGAVTTRNGSSRYSLVNGPRTCTNETVL
ncbi:sex peptide receptor isoform X2 [Tribolium castaneum]|uniref:sex peptide receptor isoform X2 n=1 Tax=Tribolium castaneum TaxID=7070 RepID=UPI00077DA867|nr:PREDICTED: sex peptide receptor isoform X2 [Tribolium castaneum]|eukprot:XP_015833259.1 PREDICTED: sex peptide receptor isoform X2 [Tribolium castaneum]